MSHYPTQVEFDRYFLSGPLEGITQTQKMNFMSWDDACKWAGSVTLNPEVAYVVLKMTNLNTGDVERF